MSQAPLSAYYQSIAHYELFLAFCLLGGVALAGLMARHAQKRKSAFFVPLWASVALGLALRLPLLVQPYWYDETFTSALVGLDWLRMGIVITGDVHPPLYYAIVKIFVTMLGHNDIVMRLPALLAGLAFIGVMHRIGQLWRVGNLTAFIIAILPGAIYYSAEGRYPMFLALMLAIAYLAIERNKALWFSGALTVAGLVHVNAWFYVLVMGAMWLYRQRQPLAVIAPAFAIALWLPVALMQAQDVSDGFWLTQQLPLRHLIEMSLAPSNMSAELVALPIVLISALLISALWLFRAQARLPWLALVALVPAVQFGVGLVWHPVYLPRTLLFSTALLAVPVAWALQRYALNWAQWSGLLAVVMSGAMLYRMDRSNEALEATQACAGFSTVYASNVHSAITARHYLPEAEIMLYEQGNSRAQQLPERAQRALFTIAPFPPGADTCFFSQISVFNSAQEMAQINAIAEQASYRVTFRQGKNGYYLVMWFKEVLK